MVLETNWV